MSDLPRETNLLQRLIDIAAAVPVDPPSKRGIVRLTLEEFKPGANGRIPGTDRLSGGHPWVSEILAVAADGRLIRHFLDPVREFGLAHPSATRGVYAVFSLQPGRYYEVFAQLTWRRSERYFCRAEGGEIVRMKAEEVLQCLSGS